MDIQSDAETSDVTAGGAPEPIPNFQTFLESQHPSVLRSVGELWVLRNTQYGKKRKVMTPALRLHCQICEGTRTFRCDEDPEFGFDNSSRNLHLRYQCGDCHQQEKRYSLYLDFGSGDTGLVFKYGELPPFGIPVPARVLRLFGEDAAIFLKGRQCENQGLGVGAFAYYRRVVESHKDDIFDEVIKVCQTVGADDLVPELEAAKNQISFSKAMDQIKLALPQGLLINGHNPLTALHGALSVGLHNQSDAECLEAAQAVRLVLTDLVERIHSLKQDNNELKKAVKLLISKKT